MTDQEKQRKLVEALGDYIARYVEENSPVTRGFQPYGLTVDVCGTKNLSPGMLPSATPCSCDCSLEWCERAPTGSIPTSCPLPMLRRPCGSCEILPPMSSGSSRSGIFPKVWMITGTDLL